jgi:toxin CcdB
VAQFRVYRLGNGLMVLDLQSDLIATASRMVAPLVPVTVDLEPLRGLEPVFEIEGRPLALHTGEMAAVPARLLTAPLADLSGRDYEIRRALDLLFSGF